MCQNLVLVFLPSLYIFPLSKAFDNFRSLVRHSRIYTTYYFLLYSAESKSWNCSVFKNVIYEMLSYRVYNLFNAFCTSDLKIWLFSVPIWHGRCLSFTWPLRIIYRKCNCIRFFCKPALYRNASKILSKILCRRNVEM